MQSVTLCVMRDLVVIAHDMRSAHNIGSLFRTAEGLGVTKLILSGITPYPKQSGDKRLPHLAEKLDKQIEKTALGATRTLPWEYVTDLRGAIERLRAEGYTLAALEQSEDSVSLHEFSAPDNIALLLGNEVSGLDPELLGLASTILEIPMSGQKESFNVVQAAAMALYTRITN